MLRKIGVNEAGIKDMITRRHSVKSHKKPQNEKVLFGSTHNNREFHQAKNLSGAPDSSGKRQKHEMDMKFPIVPLEALSLKELRVAARMAKPKVEPTPEDTEATLIAKLKPAAIGVFKREDGTEVQVPGAQGGGESSALVRPENRSKTDPNIGLSEDEQKAKGYDDDLLPVLEGMVANIVDQQHWWIDFARKLEMPIRAGISGTTQRFMNMAKLLGAEPYGARLAMVGHLVPMNAHSFHEICVAAKATCEYKPGKYVPFKPIEDETMKEIAKAVGAASEEAAAKLLGI